MILTRRHLSISLLSHILYTNFVFLDATGLEFYMDDYANDMEAEVGEHDEEARPNMRISALAPGLSSLANSHPSMHNIDRTYLDSRVDYEGMQAPVRMVV